MSAAKGRSEVSHVGKRRTEEELTDTLTPSVVGHEAESGILGLVAAHLLLETGLELELAGEVHLLLVSVRVGVLAISIVNIVLVDDAGGDLRIALEAVSILDDLVSSLSIFSILWLVQPLSSFSLVVRISLDVINVVLVDEGADHLFVVVVAHVDLAFAHRAIVRLAV